MVYTMPDRTRKTRSRDANQRAWEIVREAVGEDAELQESLAEAERAGKNPAAVLLGRLGGLRGGRARAEKLSPERRREIARKAAKARWSKESE